MLSAKSRVPAAASLMCSYCLAYGAQCGTTIISHSMKAERLRKNIALFDFELTDEEIQAIYAPNQNRRFNDLATFYERAFGMFCTIHD